MFTEDELDPWLIVRGQATDATVALWKIAQAEEPSLAIFSDRATAEKYAQENLIPAAPATASGVELWRPMRFEQAELLRLMADSFRQGIRYAALNPSKSGARQVFVLRDVLKAARSRLKADRN